MADYDFPPDLLDLQRAWYAADARCVEIAASHPKAVDQVAGTAAVSDAQYAELKAARAKRWALTVDLQDHDWWGSVEDRLAAKAALRKAAQQ